MKKFFSIVALSAMTLSLSSFTINIDPDERDCFKEGWDAGTNAAEAGGDDEAVFKANDFAFTACEAGLDYMILIMSFR